MVIFGTLGLAVPYTPRPPGETDQRKCVFLGGALAAPWREDVGPPASVPKGVLSWQDKAQQGWTRFALC